MNNTTEIFTTLYSTGLSLLANYGPSFLSLATLLYLVKLVFDWWIRNRSSDRQFLRNDIYSPLYEEIKLIGENIYEFENCFSEKSIHTPANIRKISGNVRNSLIQSGKYKLIPDKLRKDIDTYYESVDEFNKQLRSVGEEIIKIFTLEIRKIKTEENQKKFLHENKEKAWRYDEARKKRICNRFSTFLDLKFLIKGQLPNHIPQLNERCNEMNISTNSSKWDYTITIDDLNRNSLNIEDFLEILIGLVNQETEVIKLRALQQHLINQEKLLLQKIEKRIHNPNPLIEKLGI